MNACAVPADGRPDPARFDGLSPWLDPRDIDRLRRHWQWAPLRLALRPSTWPDSQRLAHWMRTDRLRDAQARLWRPVDGAGVPLDPRAWTRDRRLGDQVISGLLDADAVGDALTQGAWLHLQHLHRLDASLAHALSGWQAALGVPLRAHGWRGQAPQPAGLARQARPFRLDLDAAGASAARMLIVVEGEMTATWTPPGAPGCASRRHLKAVAGEMLYLPAAGSLAWHTRGAVWAVELRLSPLTPVDVLAEWGDLAATALRDDPALRRCVSPFEENDGDVLDAQRFVMALRQAVPAGAATSAARRHQARTDEDTTASAGRLGTLSRLFEADGQTLLTGMAGRVAGTRRAGGQFTVALARKELHFGEQAAELLAFMLRPGPYRLADAPGRFALADRLQLARSLAVEGLVGVWDDRGTAAN